MSANMQLTRNFLERDQESLFPEKFNFMKKIEPSLKVNKEAIQAKFDFIVSFLWESDSGLSIYMELLLTRLKIEK